nr:alpha-l-rhamnosidase rgxb [Quercus suber]
MLLAQFVASQTAPVYTPVPYQQAPAYYPGSPYTFPAASTRSGKTCYVTQPADGSDAVPHILSAFNDCKKNAKVVFNATTYNVSSVMETTGLFNVEVEILGTLLWSSDIQYWLNHSLPEGYQNACDHIHIYGHGLGTLNGNGDTWYYYALTRENITGRPHQITFRNLTNSVVEGIRFIRSQSWSMTLMNSNTVLLQDIYINNTFSTGRFAGGAAQNTDGVDTLYSSNLTFARWVVDNGDDAISTKANSSNVLIEDCSFYRGYGFALGSIGQYRGWYETITNVTANRIYASNTAYAMYAKIWSGSPPAGSHDQGGGTGLIRNVTMSNVTLVNVGHNDSLHYPFYTTQCYGFTGGCDSSVFQMADIRMRHVSGTSNTSTFAGIHCSHAAPCTGFELSDITVTSGGVLDTTASCSSSNVKNITGFTCN